MPFLISDIRALWRSALSPEPRVPECQKLKKGILGLYGAKYSKCDYMITLGFKGLNILSFSCLLGTCNYNSVVVL